VLKAATVIQSTFRRHVAQKQYKLEKQAAIMIESAVRRHQAIAERKVLKAATVIQTTFRRHVAQKQYKLEKQAAIMIESAVRRHQAIAERKVLKAATVIQTTFRRHVAQKQYKLEKQAAIMIESAVRRHQAITERKVLKAATVIQTTFRRHIAQKQYKLEKQAAVQLQAVARGVQARRAFLSARSHIVLLQSLVRMRLAQARRSSQVNAIVTLQSWARTMRERRIYQIKLHMHRAAIVVQSAIRRHLAIRLVEKEDRAATVIQAHWRGFLERRRAHRRIQEAARKLALARRRVTEEKKLGALTVKALDILMQPGKPKLSLVIRSCELLELATYVSSSCYQKIMELKIVETIFELMRSCNRSEPHLKLVTLALNILYNLVVASEETARHVFECPQSIQTLVDQMAHSRDRAELLMRITDVMLVLCSSPERAWATKQLNVAARIESIVTVVERKVESTSRSRGNSATAARKQPAIDEFTEATVMMRTLLRTILEAKEVIAPPPAPLEPQSPAASALLPARIKTPRSAVDHTPRLAGRGISRAVEEIERNSAAAGGMYAADFCDSEIELPDAADDDGVRAVGRNLYEFLHTETSDASSSIDDEDLLNDPPAVQPAYKSPELARFGVFDRLAAPSARRPSTAGTSRPSTAGSSRPSTAGTSRPSTAGASRPSTAGASRPSTAGSSRPSTAGTSRALPQSSSASSITRASSSSSSGSLARPPSAPGVARLASSSSSVARCSLVRPLSTSNTAGRSAITTGSGASSSRSSVLHNDGAPRKSTTSERIAQLRKKQREESGER